MESGAFRSTAKQVIPPGIAQALAASKECVRRASTWLQVANSIRGRTAADRKVLWRSILDAPAQIRRALDRWREPVLVADADLHVKGIGTFAIRGGSDDLGNVLPVNFTELFAVIRARLGKGDVAIDAGANIGAVTVYMAKRVGRAGRVVAVEMMPGTAGQLRRNLTLNGLQNVTVFEQALSDTAGETAVALIEPGFFGQASITSAQRPNVCQPVEVRTVTLNEITAGLGEIALMKMDLEGAEPQALRGASRALQRVRNVAFESWDRDGGVSAKILREAGFSIAPIDGRNFLATREPRS
jgi:FkbM family methyltransferase